MRTPNPSTAPGILLVIFLGTAPVGGAATILHQPDRRAIPLLVSRSGNLQKYGTGVVVGPDAILTAQHVLGGNIQVLLPGNRVPGRAACRTRYEGLAVVQARLPPDAPYYRLSLRIPSAGEKVTVAGYPLRRWRVVAGRVTGMIRSANLSGRAVRVPMIIFKPALDYGASGAPVLDARGQVIAITLAANRPANYNIALPISTGLAGCREFVR